MSQGRYVWIAGKKVYLNPELQKEWDKLINKERYRARQEKICGQADYRRCNGDCFVCPWRKEGIVVSYETEHFAEGFGKYQQALRHGATLEIIMTALEAAKSSIAWTKDGGQYIPGLANGFSASRGERRIYKKRKRRIKNSGTRSKVAVLAA